MPSKRPQLVNGEIYHIVLRAVGDDVVFKNVKDYFRGIFSLYELNNLKSVTIWLRRQQRRREKAIEKFMAGSNFEKFLRGPTPQELSQESATAREKLVEILAFCFMTNHIHIIVRQLKENGISNFVKKVSGGYASYFNIKYSRKGHLFNKFKAVHVKTDSQLRNALVYVWCNSVSLIEPGFKKKGIRNASEKKVLEFLTEKYRWSSFFDCIGTKNFPSVTDREFVLEFMGGEKGCKEAVVDWIKYKKSITDFGDIILE
jgi:putative transposase